jgi:TPP-dependent pyruvate/acetoin dehydrogenase alpha subunit
MDAAPKATGIKSHLTGQRDSGAVGPNTQTRLRLYETMYLIRRTEEILMAEYHPANEMRCPMHFCIGQEAMPAALGCMLRPSDVLMSHYRSHGYYLAKGAPLDAMVAEFYGKASGSNRGIAGSMELGHHDYHFHSCAIVGGSLPIPLGAAFAQKYRGEDNISVAVIGDGALDEGVSYELFNLAALHKLPLLVICENNHYAAHTAVEGRMASPELTQRARVFGLSARKLDGNDPELLLRQLQDVIPELRAGSGPVFLEVETYRLCAHVGPEDDIALGYRTAEEIEHWKKRDPVIRMRKMLASAVDAKQLLSIESKTEERIQTAIAAAKADSFEDFSKVMKMNWSDEYSPKVKQFVEDPLRTFEGGQAETRLHPF